MVGEQVECFSQYQILDIQIPEVIGNGIRCRGVEGGRLLLLRIDHEHNLDKILECKRIVEVAQLHLVCFDEIVLIALEKVVPVVVG